MQPLEPKRWYALRLDVDPPAKKVDLSYDGVNVGTRGLPTAFKFDTDDLRIIAGDLFLGPNSGSWDLRFDEVVVTVE